MSTLMIFDFFFFLFFVCLILKVALDLTEDEKLQLHNMAVDAGR